MGMPGKVWSVCVSATRALNEKLARLRGGSCLESGERLLGNILSENSSLPASADTTDAFHLYRPTIPLNACARSTIGCAVSAEQQRETYSNEDKPCCRLVQLDDNIGFGTGLKFTKGRHKMLVHS